MSVKSYETQTNVVVTQLQKKGYTREEALKIWLTSKTKAIIQDEKKMTFVSGARCYDELLMEMNNDSYWMKGSFE